MTSPTSGGEHMEHRCERCGSIVRGTWNPNETPEELADRLKRVQAFVDECNPAPAVPLGGEDKITVSVAYIAALGKERDDALERCNLLQTKADEFDRVNELRQQAMADVTALTTKLARAQEALTKLATESSIHVDLVRLFDCDTNAAVLQHRIDEARAALPRKEP